MIEERGDRGNTVTTHHPPPLTQKVPHQGWCVCGGRWCGGEPGRSIRSYYVRRPGIFPKRHAGIQEEEERLVGIVWSGEGQQQLQPASQWDMKIRGHTMPVCPKCKKVQRQAVSGGGVGWRARDPSLCREWIVQVAAGMDEVSQVCEVNTVIGRESGSSGMPGIPLSTTPLGKGNYRREGTVTPSLVTCRLCVCVVCGSVQAPSFPPPCRQGRQPGGGSGGGMGGGRW